MRFTANAVASEMRQANSKMALSDIVRVEERRMGGGRCAVEVVWRDGGDGDGDARAR